MNSNNKPTTPSPTQAHPEQNLGVRNASNAFINLWEKAHENLTDDELNWFSSLADVAATEADNIARNIENIGCLVGSDTKTGSFQRPECVANLLFSLSHQVGVISALITVADSARIAQEWRARKTAGNKKPA